MPTAPAAHRLLVAMAVLLGVATPVAGQVSEGAPGPALVRYAVDTEASTLYVVLRRSGLFGFLGHDHALGPRRWSARICLAPGGPPRGRGAVDIETASLVIDTDSLRALAELGDGPGEDDVRDIQEDMLSAEYLDAARYPEIRIELDEVTPEAGGDGPGEAVDREADASRGEGDALRGRGRIRLHGVSRAVTVPLRMDRSSDGRFLVVSGRLELLQSDFGIEPASVAGVVNVADEVELVFRVQARRLEEPCP